MKRLFSISKYKKLGSYFIELIIVILGVSIAFQLNVWKDDSKHRELEGQLLENFITENNLNIDEIIGADLQLEKSIEANPKLIDLLKNTNSNLDSIKIQLAVLYSISWPDISTTHLNNYLLFTSALTPMREEMLVLKSYYDSVDELVTLYVSQKQLKYFDQLSDVVDMTDSLKIINKEKLFSAQTRNQLLMIFFYEISLRDTIDKIKESQRKIIKLIEEKH